MHYESMLCSDGWVRVRRPRNHNKYDERGWSNQEVLIERWLLVDEMRAEQIAVVTEAAARLAAMQAEMDAIEKQSDKKLTGAARQAVSK